MSYFPTNEVFLTKLKKWRLPFFATFLFGLLIHGFVFANRLPNWDGLRNFYSPEQMDTSGRFFLTYATGISSYFDLPWVTGILSIIYVAIIVVMIIELFNIASPLVKILIAVMTVALPNITSTFAYMYTADGYLFATMLTMVALVLLKNFRWGMLVAPLLIFVAVGIYQANLAVALSFVILYLMYLTVIRNRTLKEIMQQAIKFVIPIMVGMIVYLLYYKYKTTLGGVDITDYKGLDEAGQLSITDLPERIVYMFEYMLTFFFSGTLNPGNWNLYEMMNAILLVLLFVIGAVSIMKVKDKIPMLSVLLVLMIGLPFAMFVIVYTSPSVEYHTIMTFSTLAVYLIPLLFMEDLLKLDANRVRKVMVYVTTVFAVLVTFNFAVISNIAYMNMEYRTEKTVNLLNRIATSIESHPEYLEAERLHVIGRPKLDSSVFEKKLKANIPFIQGADGRHAIKGEVQLVNGLQNYIGLEFKGLSNEERDKINARTEVEDMKIWPDEDALLLINNTLVIKFPKK